MKKTFKFLLRIFLPSILVFSVINLHIASAGTYWSLKSFRRPIDTILNPVFSSYYDNDPSNGVLDYACGTGTYNAHKGTDFRAVINTPVYAGAGGLVYSTNNSCYTWGYLGSKCGGGFGNYVKIDHIGPNDGKGLVTIYAHLAQNTIAVKAGDQLICSKYLGSSGSSGNSTGSHVHFEVQGKGYPNDDPFFGLCGGFFKLWAYMESSGVPSTKCSFWSLW